MSLEDELTKRVIGCAMRVHRELRPGFLEIVYRNALCVEFGLENIKYSTEEPIAVFYRQIKVGSFCADIFVEQRLIIELKACEKIAAAHEVQTANYLKATGSDIALLFNFGSKSLEFKRKYRNPLPESPPSLQSWESNPVNPVNPV
jgi:GxxExxY protein